jgi:2-polyprenyl-6-methoxyphenol hydroxylase-like FAD-dependent oxidoreductase
VLDEARAAGFSPGSTAWRKLDGSMIAEIDNGVLPDARERILCLPLDRLGAILLRHLQKEPSATISWNHKVVDIGQGDDHAWLDTVTATGTQRLTAKYVVGCDGGNSQIRRSLFGDWTFPGRTWDEQIVATNVGRLLVYSEKQCADCFTITQTYNDFPKFGWGDANFIVHPEHWYMAARISNDGLWRVSYGEIPGLTRDELLARPVQKFKDMLPGSPGPEEYKVVNFSPYKIHQRLAESMAVGRFLLAADAAHCKSP